MTYDPSQLSSGLAETAETVGSVVATGTNRATAASLPSTLNIITGADSGTGVYLPAISGFAGESVIVFNDGASLAQVYALGSDTIDGVAGATGVPLTNAKRCQYFKVGATAWKSAQLGVVSA